MNAAAVVAPVAAPEPAAMEDDRNVVPAAMDNPEENEDEEEELHFVKRARGKRSRAEEDIATVVVGEKGGVDEDSPRGPLDASQRDSPDKSSDDEDGDAEGDEAADIPGKKKFKLRSKSAAEEELAAKKARDEFGQMPSDSEDDEQGEDFYYDEDDEEGLMEQRLRDKGTLSEDEEDTNAAAADEESDESELEDSEDELEEDRRAKASRAAADIAAAAKEPEFRNLETEEELAVRRAREKEEIQRTQAEIMREASRRARLTGYHVAPDRDPFAYRKIFAHIRECVKSLKLPPPPADPVVEDEMYSDEEFDDEREGDEEEEAEDDSGAEDGEEDDGEDEEDEMVELELEGDVTDIDNTDDGMAALGLDGDELAAMMATVRSKVTAKTAPDTNPIAREEDEMEVLDTSAAAAAKELAAQKALEEQEAAEAAAANPPSDDDLSEEEVHDLTRKERLRQLKRAKAFFKADAKAAAARRAGEVLEDEAEMSDDGGHTDDEEEVEVEEVNGEGEDPNGRVIRRKVAKRKDGLLDAEELEEMVDYIDFNDTADDDERRMAKRAAAHARFEEERDEEEVRKMQEALKNGFRRPNKNGGFMGEDGPDYWQRRRRANGDEESDEEDDLGIDIPERAWEAVELSDDDDGEWAERAERRKRSAAATEAAAAKKMAAVHKDTESGPNEGSAEDSQLPPAHEIGFGSQNLKAMMNAGRQRRNRVQRGTCIPKGAIEAGSAGGTGAFGAFAPPAPQAARSNNSRAAINSTMARSQRPVGLERQASTSFLGRGTSSRSNHGAAGLGRSISLGNGGASRSFVFGGGGDSQSMWDHDVEGNGTAPVPSVLAELGGNDNARTDFGWAAVEAGGAKRSAAANPTVPARHGGSGSQSLFSMLQTTSQDLEGVLSRSDSLAEGVKAAKNINFRMRPT